jgi:hypothetical protein
MDVHKRHEEIVMKQIVEDNVLTEETKKALIEYSRDETEHSTLCVTFKDLLIPVWYRIVKHASANEIKKILNQEMNDALCMCFTGRLSRLISPLVGFYDDVNIKIGNNEQISNVVIQTKEKLGKDYTIEKHKELAEAELKERGYEQSVIDEWLTFISE